MPLVIAEKKHAVDVRLLQFAYFNFSTKGYAKIATQNKKLNKEGKASKPFLKSKYISNIKIALTFQRVLPTEIDILSVQLMYIRGRLLFFSWQ